MLFFQARFFAFFALVFVVAWGLRRDAWRKAWLLAASYFFYAAWDWRFLGLIVFSTVLDYQVGRRLEVADDPLRRRRLLQVSLAANLGLLAFFKYFGFFVESARALLATAGLPAPSVGLEVILPVGISFYTFQTLSYTIDVYRGDLETCRSPLDFALFVSFFPQLVAGPIVRAADFLPQLSRRPRWADVRVAPALALFLVGLFKKTCVADNLAPHVDALFAAPEAYDGLSAWLGMACYGGQIYCDFSGYSDMAIALSALLGYRLCWNFSHPYLSCDISDFWRRWHISLSSWLRDYLYIPLGGNRGGRFATQRNLMLTMLLGGLWHGASWTFVAWGGVHGLALALRQGYRALQARGVALPTPPRLVGWAMTWVVVHLAWVLFRAPNFGVAAAVFGAMAGQGAGASLQLSRGLVPMLGVLWGLHVVAERVPVMPAAQRMHPVALAALLGVGTGLALHLMPLGAQPFIYFQF